jgi:hypothetical protein
MRRVGKKMEFSRPSLLAACSIVDYVNRTAELRQKPVETPTVTEWDLA